VETRWEVGGWAVGRDKSVRTVGSVGRVGGEEDLISVELVAKVEVEACRLARETAGGGKGKVGGDQERVNVFSP
jgi:hypothetical protein